MLLRAFHHFFCTPSVSDISAAELVKFVIITVSSMFHWEKEACYRSIIF
jgi:hypothetical protein